MNNRFIGLDLHRDTIYVTVLSIADNTAPQFEIKAKDFELFADTLGPGDQVALESTRGSRYYVKRLQARGVAVAVANPMKLDWLKGETAKNDRNDSFRLALLLALGTLPTLWVPDDETQQDRELLHYRCTLVQDQTRIKNRIQALMAEHGVGCPSDIQSQDAQLLLLRLTTGLPGTAREVLTGQLEQLEQLEVRLARVEAIVEVRAARRPEVALLMTVRGLNVVTALTILAAIGPIERFSTPGSLANYAGLVPRQRASAGHSHQGKITKAGSKTLRWALTEGVRTLCKADGPYRNLCQRLERKKKNKGQAITACARKLLVAIWHMLTHNETFRFAEPDLVERKVKRREQRLAAARQTLARDKKDRQREIIVRQLALVQELAKRGTTLPLPAPLRATFGRARTVSSTPTAIAPTG